MFVNVTAQGPASLEDIDNFRSLKVIFAKDSSLQNASDFGKLDGDHVWLDRNWLSRNGRPDDISWVAGFDKMIQFAQASGWVDGAGNIRAHIESI